MSDSYPTLTDMGIVNPQQIDRYSLQSLDNNDVLRIIYKREKGSLLPSSKKFKFPRHNRTVNQDSNKNETISEVSPALNNAISELHKLVTKKHSRSEQKEIITDEIQRLEEEINSRVNYLKSLIKKLEE